MQVLSPEQHHHQQQLHPSTYGAYSASVQQGMMQAQQQQQQQPYMSPQYLHPSHHQQQQQVPPHIALSAGVDPLHNHNHHLSPTMHHLHHNHGVVPSSPSSSQLVAPKKKRRSPSLYIPPEFVAWLNANYVANADESVPKDSIYRKYCLFCREHDIAPKKSNIFGKMLKKMFPNLRPRRLGSAGNMVAHYAGIAPRIPRQPGEEEESLPSSPYEFSDYSSGSSSGSSSPLSRSAAPSPVPGSLSGESSCPSSVDNSATTSPAVGSLGKPSAMCMSPSPFATVMTQQQQQSHAFAFNPINFASQAPSQQQPVYYTVTPPAPPMPSYPTYFQQPMQQQSQQTFHQQQMAHYGQPQQHAIQQTASSEPLLAARQSPQFALKNIFEEMRHDEEEEALNNLAVPLSGPRNGQSQLWAIPPEQTALTAGPLSAGLASAMVESHEIKPEPVMMDHDAQHSVVPGSAKEQRSISSSSHSFGSIDGPAGILAHFDSDEILKFLNNNSFSIGQNGGSISLPTNDASAPLAAQWTCPPQFEFDSKTRLSLLGTTGAGQSSTRLDQPV